MSTENRPTLSDTAFYGTVLQNTGGVTQNRLEIYYTVKLIILKRVIEQSWHNVKLDLQKNSNIDQTVSLCHHTVLFSVFVLKSVKGMLSCMGQFELYWME